MNVKKIKRKCGVRGCKNIDNVFIISKTREMSNSLIMCTECMKSAFAETETYVEPPKVKKEVKSLFPHPELNVTLSSVADEEPEPEEVIEDIKTEDDILVAEDTVTIDEILNATPDEVKKPTKSVSSKKKTNKKK